MRYQTSHSSAAHLLPIRHATHYFTIPDMSLSYTAQYPHQNHADFWGALGLAPNSSPSLVLKAANAVHWQDHDATFHDMQVSHDE